MIKYWNYKLRFRNIDNSLSSLFASLDTFFLFHVDETTEFMRILRFAKIVSSVTSTRLSIVNDSSHFVLKNWNSLFPFTIIANQFCNFNSIFPLYRYDYSKNTIDSRWISILSIPFHLYWMVCTCNLYIWVWIIFGVYAIYVELGDTWKL